MSQITKEQSQETEALQNCECTENCDEICCGSDDISETFTEGECQPDNLVMGQSAESVKPPKKSIIEKLPPKLRKAVEYINSHEDVRQMVFFLMFSVLCGASQMIVTYALSAGLKLAPSLTAGFNWFVFHFATTAEFIGFLIGSIVGQALTFILNRKKTFNTTDYIVVRAIMYAIMAIIIIIMQTYLGGVVTSACYGAVPENEASEFLKLVFNLTGQAVAGIAAVIVNFLGNKFFIMRDWGKKKAKNQIESECGEMSAEIAADNAEAEVGEVADVVVSAEESMRDSIADARVTENETGKEA